MTILISQEDAEFFDTNMKPFQQLDDNYEEEDEVVEEGTVQMIERSQEGQDEDQYQDADIIGEDEDCIEDDEED